MPRPATGGVVERNRKRGIVYGLRFRAYGDRQFVTLGSAADGWTRAKAEAELQNVLADVRRGIWRPPEPEPIVEPAREPTLHEFASEWLNARRHEWQSRTRLGQILDVAVRYDLIDNNPLRGKIDKLVVTSDEPPAGGAEAAS
jgi:hypothetical protein